MDRSLRRSCLNLLGQLPVTRFDVGSILSRVVPSCLHRFWSDKYRSRCRQREWMDRLGLLQVREYRIRRTCLLKIFSRIRHRLGCAIRFDQRFLHRYWVLVPFCTSRDMSNFTVLSCVVMCRAMMSKFLGKSSFKF